MKKILMLAGVMALVASTAFAGYGRNHQQRQRLVADSYSDQTRIFLYSTPSDKQVMSAIQQQLKETNFDLTANDVYFSINNGVVTVTGKLASQADADTLQSSLAGVTGVTDVIINAKISGADTNLNLNPSTQNQYNRNISKNRRGLTADAISDNQIKTQLQSLFSDKSFKQQFPNVNFQVKNGTIQLTGNVKSITAKQTVESKVKAAAGASQIQNLLEIKK